MAVMFAVFFAIVCTADSYWHVTFHVLLFFFLLTVIWRIKMNIFPRYGEWVRFKVHHQRIIASVCLIGLVTLIYWCMWWQSCLVCFLLALLCCVCFSFIVHVISYIGIGGHASQAPARPNFEVLLSYDSQPDRQGQRVNMPRVVDDLQYAASATQSSVYMNKYLRWSAVCWHWTTEITRRANTGATIGISHMFCWIGSSTK